MMEDRERTYGFVVSTTIDKDWVRAINDEEYKM